MIRVLDVIEDTMVDGPGFRTSIYCAGCRHKCPGCHNPQSWDFNGGRWMSTEELMKIIVADPFANVTFTGGDPMYQCDGFAELARAIHQQTNKDIWCYTGFSFESLITRAQRELLELVARRARRRSLHREAPRPGSSLPRQQQPAPHRCAEIALCRGGHPLATECHNLRKTILDRSSTC